MDSVVNGVVRRINHHGNGIHIEVDPSEPVAMLQFPFTAESIDELFKKAKMVALPATPETASQFSVGQKVGLLIDLGPGGKPFYRILDPAEDV